MQTWKPGALTTAEARAEPAPEATVIRALSGCLTLTAPSGFSEGDRKAWLTAAAMTLKGIPAELLDWGVTHARKIADHPAKIVPAIMEEIGPTWERRRQDLARERNALHARQLPPPRADGFEPCTPEQAAEILAEFPQLKSQTRAMLTQHVGERRKPTRQDYIDMGVDPSVLDNVPA